MLFQCKPGRSLSFTLSVRSPTGLGLRTRRRCIDNSWKRICWVSRKVMETEFLFPRCFALHHGHREGRRGDSWFEAYWNWEVPYPLPSGDSEAQSLVRFIHQVPSQTKIFLGESSACFIYICYYKIIMFPHVLRLETVLFSEIIYRMTL